MRNKLNLLAILAAGWTAYAAVAGDFLNLDFELANTNSLTVDFSAQQPYLVGAGPMSDMVPGWHLTYGSFEALYMNLNGLPNEPSGVSLVSQDALGGTYGGLRNLSPGAFQGRYALVFSVDNTPFFLSQEGVVPPDARTLTLVPEPILGPNPTLHVETWMNETLIENGDVSAFAGQDVNLEFKIWGLSTFPNIIIDEIKFNVPEPAIDVLFLAAGAVAILWRCRLSTNRTVSKGDWTR